jgi:hypothetical protein
LTLSSARQHLRAANCVKSVNSFDSGRTKLFQFRGNYRQIWDIFGPSKRETLLLWPMVSATVLVQGRGGIVLPQRETYDDPLIMPVQRTVADKRGHHDDHNSLIIRRSFPLASAVCRPCLGAPVALRCGRVCTDVGSVQIEEAGVSREIPLCPTVERSSHCFRIPHFVALPIVVRAVPMHVALDAAGERIGWP